MLRSPCLHRRTASSLNSCVNLLLFRFTMDASSRIVALWLVSTNRGQVNPHQDSIGLHSPIPVGDPLSFLISCGPGPDRYEFSYPSCAQKQNQAGPLGIRQLDSESLPARLRRLEDASSQRGTGLNRGENYHQLRRAVSYANFGKQGIVHIRV